jgi:hypothetical protein
MNSTDVFSIKKPSRSEPNIMFLYSVWSPEPLGFRSPMFEVVRTKQIRYFAPGIKERQASVTYSIFLSKWFPSCQPHCCSEAESIVVYCILNSGSTLHIAKGTTRYLYINKYIASVMSLGINTEDIFIIEIMLVD